MSEKLSSTESKPGPGRLRRFAAGIALGATIASGAGAVRAEAAQVAKSDKPAAPAEKGESKPSLRATLKKQLHDLGTARSRVVRNEDGSRKDVAEGRSGESQRWHVATLQEYVAATGYAITPAENGKLDPAAVAEAAKAIAGVESDTKKIFGKNASLSLRNENEARNAKDFFEACVGYKVVTDYHANTLKLAEARKIIEALPKREGGVISTNNSIARYALGMDIPRMDTDRTSDLANIAFYRYASKAPEYYDRALANRCIASAKRFAKEPMVWNEFGKSLTKEGLTTKVSYEDEPGSVKGNSLDMAITIDGKNSAVGFAVERLPFEDESGVWNSRTIAEINLEFPYASIVYAK